MIHSFKLGWEQGVPIYTQAYRLSGCLQCFLRACVHRHLPASFRQILLHTALKILARHQVCLRIFALSATKFARKSAHISYEHKLSLLSECKMCVCKKTLDFFHKTCYNKYAVFENDFYIFWQFSKVNFLPLWWNRQTQGTLMFVRMNSASAICSQRVPTEKSVV